MRWGMIRFVQTFWGSSDVRRTSVLVGGERRKGRGRRGEGEAGRHPLCERGLTMMDVVIEKKIIIIKKSF